MTLRFTTLSFLINLLACCALCAQDQTIPALHHWVAKKGKLAISARSSIVVDPSIHEMLRSDLQTFQNELFAISNLRLAVKEDAGQSKPGDIVIKPGNDLDKDAQAEGYKLNITDRATIHASSATGFFYGMQT